MRSSWNTSNASTQTVKQSWKCSRMKLMAISAGRTACCITIYLKYGKGREYLFLDSTTMTAVTSYLYETTKHLRSKRGFWMRRGSTKKTSNSADASMKQKPTYIWGGAASPLTTKRISSGTKFGGLIHILPRRSWFWESRIPLKQAPAPHPHRGTLRILDHTVEILP